MEDIEIIENTKEGRNIYGHWWGSSQLELTTEHLNVLLAGKCIACNNGEYATFISLEMEVK